MIWNIYVVVNTNWFIIQVGSWEEGKHVIFMWQKTANEYLSFTLRD